jgi:acyl carrier protein
MTVRDDVAGAVMEVCGVEADDLQDDAALDSLEVDSLDLIEVGMIMEAKHGIRVSSDDFEDVATFGDAVAVFDRIVASGTTA